MTLQEFMERNTALRHAIQTGIAIEMQHNEKVINGKHLRVGLNANMVEVAAIVNLLINKGLITEEEYFDISIKFMEREVKNQERILSENYGVTITLG